MNEAANRVRLKVTNNRAATELFSTIDGYIKTGAVVATAGGFAAWLIFALRNIHTTASLIYLVLPSVFAFVVVAGVVAPVMTLGIKLAEMLVKLHPSRDVYSRILVVLCLPFAFTMILGPHVDESGVVQMVLALVWVLTPCLFAYFMRDEPVTWAVQCCAGVTFFFLSWVPAALLAQLVPLILGPVYVEAMPPNSLLISLSSGHIPVPVEISSTEPTTIDSQTVEVPVFDKPAATTTGISDLGPIASSQELTAPLVPTLLPGLPHLHPDDPSPVAPPVASRGDLIAAQTALPEWKGITKIVQPVTSSPWFLLVKQGSDTASVSIERWNADTVEKKGALVYQELPGRPNQYALSPKGEYLVTLVTFPVLQAEIYSFAERRKLNPIVLTEPNATATLLGFIDSAHFVVLWEKGGRRAIQISNVSMPEATRKFLLSSQGTAHSPWGLSQNGQELAIAGFGEPGTQLINIHSTIDGHLVRRIVMTDPNYICTGVRFSLDSAKLAVICRSGAATSAAVYRMSDGQNIASVIFAGNPSGVSSAPALHSVEWLADGATLVENGRSLYDLESGRRIGPLEFGQVTDQGITANKKLILLGDCSGPGSVVLAEVDPAAVKKIVDGWKGH
jgi:hypothetical protein